jgi:hypothetical protein
VRASRLLGRVGNKRLIIGLLPIRCIWFGYVYIVIPYRRKGSPEVVCRGLIARFRTLRHSSYILKSSLGLTLLVRNFFPLPLRYSAYNALPYIRLYIYSSSLLV